MKKLLFILALFLILLGAQMPVRAQEINISETTTKYKQLLETYRQSDQQYLVAYQQFLQLKTLASQEVMVTQAKAAMTARADLLDTYLLLLSQILMQTKGVELSKQQMVINLIEQQRTYIRQHKEVIANMSDRVELQLQTVEFQKHENAIVNAAYSTLALVKMAQIQNSIDQLQSPIQMISQSLENSGLDQVKIEEKKRGLTEINRQTDLIRQSLSAAAEEYDASIQSNSFSSDDYTTITGILNSAYAKTKLVLSYVEELAK